MRFIFGYAQYKMNPPPVAMYNTPGIGFIFLPRHSLDLCSFSGDFEPDNAETRDSTLSQIVIEKEARRCKKMIQKKSLPITYK